MDRTLPSKTLLTTLEGCYYEEVQTLIFTMINTVETNDFNNFEKASRCSTCRKIAELSGIFTRQRQAIYKMHLMEWVICGWIRK